jgi:Protein of unknown function with HXXEE motif
MMRHAPFMSTSSVARVPSPPLFLFPVTYVLHIVEESWGGESFPVWASRVSGTTVSVREFVVLNAVALVVMCIAAAAAQRTARARWVIAALATVTLANGSLHLLASLVTQSYSPGVVSGVLAWIPLGAVTLRRAFAAGPARVFWRGCVTGLVVHALVSALALAVD